MTKPYFKWCTPEEFIALADELIQQHGLNDHYLGEAAGMGSSQIWKIRTGVYKRVHPHTMDKLRTLEHLDDVLEARYQVPILASRIRVRCMALEGFGWFWFEQQMGTPQRFRKASTQVTRVQAQRIIDVLLKAEAETPGPNAQAIKVARGKGYLPIERYDRDLLLDPDWTGLGGVLPARSAHDVKVEEFQALLELGVPIRRAAEQAGITTYWLQKHGYSSGTGDEDPGTRLRLGSVPVAGRTRSG